MLTFAAASAPSAYSDIATAAVATPPSVEAVPSTVMLTGVIRTRSVHSSDVVLTTEGCRACRLLGPVAELLGNAGGMAVWVSGEMLSANEMLLQNYAFRDGNADDRPMVKILPHLGRPCDDPASLQPIDPSNRAVWNWKRP